MEIYTLTISFPYDQDEVPWTRTIEVKENFTLQQLHNFIQEVIEFDNDHLYEFYVGRNARNRMDSISKRTKLSEVYPLSGLKLFYLFDFGDDWLFQVKKSRKKKLENKEIKYPVLIDSSGINPEQYPEYED